MKDVRLISKLTSRFLSPKKQCMVNGIVMDCCRLSRIFLKQILLGPVERPNICLCVPEIKFAYRVRWIKMARDFVIGITVIGK